MKTRLPTDRRREAASVTNEQAFVLRFFLVFSGSFSLFTLSIKIPFGFGLFHLPGAARFVNAAFLCDNYLLKWDADKLGPYWRLKAARGGRGAA